MALYRYPQYIALANPNDVFDTFYEPGARTPLSGIYRCEGCGHEVVHTHDRPLPPQNHHTHRDTRVAIQWRLVVTDQRPAA